MGCDIHAAIEYRQSAGKPWQVLLTKDPLFGKYSWHDKEYTASLHIDRDYDLFAILGNVRNGSGFAGCDTGDGFDPMTDNQGVPDDISEEAKDVLSNEHSATWVTLAEILAYDWDRTTKHRGWVTAVTFEKWDRMKEWKPFPDEWCGGVDGSGVKHVSIEEMRRIVKDAVGDRRGSEFEDAIAQLKNKHFNTYCLTEWETSYSMDGRQMWEKILPKMLNVGRIHGFDNVRMVMDFDS